MRASSYQPRFASNLLGGLACVGVTAILWSLALSVAAAQKTHDHHHGDERHFCREPSLACATTATPTFAPDGALWLAFATADHILVANSTDYGRSLSAPTAVTAEPQPLDWGPDSRPAIVVHANERISIAYAIFKDKAFNGQVLYTYSKDGGRTFAPAKAVTQDAESQRFAVLGLDPRGRLFAAWLDKRNRASARARGETYTGAGLAYAWVEPDGAIGDTSLAVDNTCECCRIGLDFAAAGRPVLLFRNIFERIVRDHAVVTFTAPGTPGVVTRVSEDDWQTDTCPHQGPSLAISPAGTYHAAWFTNGRARQGLFYARSVDGGRSFSPPLQLGSPDGQPSRPAVLATSRATWVAWKELQADNTVLMIMTSHDDGATWTSPRAITQTSGDSDHPMLVTDSRRSFASWLTRKEGYRLLPLDGAQ
jgi:hypothetical protein